MTDGMPPRDTLTVTGGRALTRVDAAAVLGAAAPLADAAALLRAASVRCGAVAAALRRPRWVPAPPGAFSPGPFAGGADPLDAATRARAASLAGDAAARLGRRAEAVDVLALRLRIAAGLYERSESAVEQLAGGAMTGLFALVGLVADSTVLPHLRLAAAVAGAVPDAGVARRRLAPPGWAGATPPTVLDDDAGDGVLADAWRAVAPYSDEAVAGLARGVSPLGGVTGGAGELARLVRSAVPATTVEVLPLPGGSGGAAGPPAWADVPSGSVAEALARTADLSPYGSGIPGRPGAGAPPGTLAVERVTHDDGTTSWTVLVPGTQGLLSADHPFDGLTDLELMAHEAAEVSQAIRQALEQAGAAPDEPVVLVGHSLGGIAAVALASSPEFRARHPVGGVVTAGSPTATFATPRGVPVLHLENDEELVSPADGRSSTENPATGDRVTVGRSLHASADPADRAASGSVALAHAIPTHLRTLAAARASGNVQVAGVADRIGRLLDGTRSRTSFFAARRVAASGPMVVAPGPGRRASAGTPSPPPGVPTGATPQ